MHTKPSKGMMTVEDMAHQFLKVIVSNYRIPKRIILNRDKLFMTKFWTILINLMGIKY